MYTFISVLYTELEVQYMWFLFHENEMLVSGLVYTFTCCFVITHNGYLLLFYRSCREGCPWITIHPGLQARQNNIHGSCVCGESLGNGFLAQCRKGTTVIVYHWKWGIVIVGVCFINCKPDQRIKKNSHPFIRPRKSIHVAFYNSRPSSVHVDFTFSTDKSQYPHSYVLSARIWC